LGVALGFAIIHAGVSGGANVANEMSAADGESVRARLIIRNIGPADLRDALIKGFEDFKNKPSHIAFLVLIYPVAIFVVIRFSAGYEMLPLLYPLVSGYALIGPVAAVGLYEESRRRELGLDVSWRHSFAIVRSRSMIPIVAVSIVLTGVFIAWLIAALIIYQLTLGGWEPTSIAEFARRIVGTPEGWALVIVGNCVGAFFAVVAMSIGVVSFPLLLDRDVDAVTAMQTSIRAVLANPMTMTLWGLIVAGALLIGSVPVFVGLAVVWPVLGHSTWHLYRKVVEH
jgi:uncharacterized membrane protein